MINPRLHDIVKQYAHFGDHRTGTPVDQATRDWFERRLQDRGAIVNEHRFEFDLYDAHASLTLAGKEIPSMPLYYEAIGSARTDNINVVEFGGGEHGDHWGALNNILDQHIDATLAAGFEALIIITTDGSGELVAMNCKPVLRDRLPVVLVGGRYAGALKAGKPVLDFNASIRLGYSSTIIGNFGDVKSAPPLVITTPLSGWFSCAGERGTGVAVALQVAHALSKHMPVKLIAPAGHELGYLGAWKYIETIKGESPPAAVLHLGSCIAAIDGQLDAIAHTSETIFKTIANALKPLDVTPVIPANPSAPACWIGESQCWAGIANETGPMLSIAGISPVFHTPLDIAETATTPALLERAATSITQAAMALVSEN